MQCLDTWQVGSSSFELALDKLRQSKKLLCRVRLQLSGDWQVVQVIDAYKLRRSNTAPVPVAVLVFRFPFQCVSSLPLISSAHVPREFPCAMHSCRSSRCLEAARAAARTAAHRADFPTQQI